jgi:hypothetical protein
MRSIAATICVLSLAVLPVPEALAQDPSTMPPHLVVPLPPPLPPPKLEIPKIPKMDEIPISPKAALPRRGSFSDRISQCIEEGAAAGLGPNERAAYSRVCANQ